ncbi:sensor histidine kinase [Nafulsella turpanensis]|uniref:sensor histidine kinase n=1 Tax=Nafulsella turpanensis TaxID=1265690 RepID=UPI000345EFF6|nr:ATP-binding protein [Nafulsella turpanensis]
MIVAGLLDNEEERLKRLINYRVLDTPEEQEFQDIVELTAQVCHAPICLITLIDTHRQWFKARVGLKIQETARDIAFCSHAIHHDDIMEVKDTLQDERFFDNPLVIGEPYIRFYAGMPLISVGGHKLGTLAVGDTRPRKLGSGEAFALRILGSQVVKLFELRSKNQKLQDVIGQYLKFYEEVRGRQEILSKVQKVAEIGIFEADLRTGQLQVSEGFCTLFGLSTFDRLSISRFKELVHPEDTAHFSENLNRSLNEPKFSFEFRCIRPSDKEIIVVKCMGESLRDKEGEPFKLIGLKQNITAIKQHEQQLEAQNAELKKLNEELDNFVYRVSHDLRAPNSSVLGLIEIILSQEQDVDKIKELLVLVRKSLQKQDNFIKDILDYSRNSRMEVKPEEVDFEEVLQEVVAQLRYSYQKESINFSVEILQEVPFATDDSRLHIILSNLLSNSFKYQRLQEHGGMVGVNVKVNEEEAQITIEDNGIGIEKSRQGKVFDMFYRATDKKPGSGLGLYIVKEALLKLQGSILLESELGKGTIVKVTIPNMYR